jgi:hypothetical protein
MLTLEGPRNLVVNSGRATLDTCNETCIWVTKSAFAGTETKDWKISSCRVQNLSDAHLLGASIAISKYQQETGKKKQ